MVKIKNKQTGEIKEVSMSELKGFGLSESDYKQFETQKKSTATSGLLESGDIPLTPENVEQYPVEAAEVIKKGKKVFTKQEQEREDAMGELVKKAEALKTVIENGQSGKLKGKQYEDALNFAASNLASAKAFAEGGKQFTGTEYGIVAGAIPITEPQRKQNIIERLTGRVPPPTGRVLDDESTLWNKTNLILETFGKKEKKTEQKKEPVSTESKPIRNITKSRSVEGFIENAGTDIGTNLQGFFGLPGALYDIGKTAVTDPGKLPQIGGNLAKGIYKEYEQLVVDPNTGQLSPTRPLEAFYERPVSTTLDVLPFLQAGKAGYAKFAGGAKNVATNSVDDVARAVGNQSDDIARAAGNYSDDAARAADAGKVSNILKKARMAGQSTDEASALAKSIYQSSFNISKKGKAFEYLKPNDTAGAMIKYGIKGNTDDILRQTEQITGDKGILSNVVNNAVADVNKPVNISKVSDYLKDVRVGRFSALGKDQIDDLSIRLTNIPQSGKIGHVEVSRLLDESRTLAKEAMAHHVAGLRGDTKALELAELKFGVVNTIDDIIDDAVKTGGNIQAYKDPALIAAIREVSPKLADDYAKAGSVSSIRSLQKPFVRMNMIIKLSQQEPSSLGQRLFRPGSSVPVLGPMLDAASQSVAVPSATMTGVALDRAAPILGPLLKNKVPLTNFGREYRQANQ